jgi:formylglycine-generating enzyme required for sulfatase activity
MRNAIVWLLGALGLALCPAWAVNIETVSVGNPGNAPDTRYATPGYGAVSYTYSMGKYEVTAGQYTEFLNAVAGDDAFGLYSTYMPGSYGCNIQRSGSAGNYTYSVPADWTNRPVSLVSWGSAARFANWLTNGQPTGAENLSTTEDGSYHLNGATTDAELMSVTRRADAKWVIPSEDEWYKAAYYDPDKVGGAGYWNFATRSDTTPSNVLSATGENNANFRDLSVPSYTIGAPYYRTEVGAFAGSPSACGTFDQAGNVDEWTEGLFFTTPSRVLRGGSWELSSNHLHAGTRGNSYPTILAGSTGFRLAYVPEPNTIGLLVVGGLVILRRRTARHRV